jgi:hypothetical protein
MLLTLEPLQAAEGDCLLLYWGTASDTKLAVIDGGPGNVYPDKLRPRLDEIRTQRALSQLPIDLVMVSHVDNDHVVGVKKLFKELKTTDIRTRPFTVKRLWHNTFNDILNDAADSYYKTLPAPLTSNVGDNPNPGLVQQLAQAFKSKYPNDTDSDEEALDIALILAGHGEGRDLRTSFEFLYNKGEIGTLNTPFKKNGKPTLISQDRNLPAQVSGLNFRIVGPMEPEIEALQEEFDKFIKAKGLVQASLLAAYADKSIRNLSSIVCLVEMGGKRILLTGDARGDKILAGLTKARLLVEGNSLHVDILKVPHHGSDRNVEPEFFKKVLANTYVFSGNGKHGNPERETLEWLAESRSINDDYKIVLTYPVKEIDAERKHHALSRGKSWNSTTDSLQAFFEKCTRDDFKFILHEGAPFKIDLGDESVPW